MFFGSIKALEKECEDHTSRYVRTSSITLRRATDQFADLYELLYRFSCCYWGCHGKEHIFEYLGGKCSNNLAVARQALYRGYYDEALSLVRTVGEIANLLNLFWHDSSAVREWADLEEKRRNSKFKPVAVRERLEKLNVMIPFEQNHYRALCNTAVHASPHIRPNAHQNKQQPILGLVFQKEGFNLVFWNMAWSLAVVSGPIAKCAIIEEEHAGKMVELTVPLFKSAIQNVPYLQES